MLRSRVVVPEFFGHPAWDFAEQVNGTMFVAQVVRCENYAVLTELFELPSHGYPVDINAHGQTLLHYAVEANNRTFVQKILRNPRFIPQLERQPHVAKFITEDPEIKKMFVTAFRKAQARDQKPDTPH
jgi:hypothetical protein